MNESSTEVSNHLQYSNEVELLTLRDLKSHIKMLIDSDEIDALKRVKRLTYNKLGNRSAFSSEDEHFEYVNLIDDIDYAILEYSKRFEF
jgi:hypothetical protein